MATSNLLSIYTRYKGVLANPVDVQKLCIESFFKAYDHKEVLPNNQGFIHSKIEQFITSEKYVFDLMGRLQQVVFYNVRPHRALRIDFKYTQGSPHLCTGYEIHVLIPQSMKTSAVEPWALNNLYNIPALRQWDGATHRLIVEDHYQLGKQTPQATQPKPSNKYIKRWQTTVGE